MAEDKAPDPKPSLPQLKNLVPVIDWQQIQAKSPIDIRVFGMAFACAITVLVPSSFFVPALLQKPPSEVETKQMHSALLMDQSGKIGGSSAVAPLAPAPADPGDYNDRQKLAVTTNDALLSEGLGPAPIDALEEPYRQGTLPRIAVDGRKPWFLYSRPFDKNDPRPRVAIMIADLGFSRLISDTAITELPGPVTLIFSSTGQAVDAWMLRARSHGHETLLSVPMEPLDYPASDPGPGSLLVKNTKNENSERLKQAMLKGKGYIGITTLTGSRITSTPDQLKPILGDVQARGLMFVDAQLTPLSSAYAISKEMGLPTVKATYRLTANMGTSALAAAFADIENTAAHEKRITVMVEPTPLILRQLIEWLPGLSQKGLALAPVTAMTD